MKKLLQSPLIFLAIFLLTLAYGAAIHFFFGTSDAAEFNRGIFGDSFGALTALFSGLGFAGLVYTLMLQREQTRISNDTLLAQQLQLNTQKEELEHTKNELKEQKEVERVSRFESRFFQMLTLSETIAAKLDGMATQPGKGYFE